MAYLGQKECKMDRKALIGIILLLVVGTGLAYWHKTQYAPQQQQQQQEWPEWQPQQPPPPVNPQTPPAAPQIKSYHDAVQLSKSSGKKLLLYFSADWCSQCQKMKSVFADPRVKTALTPYLFYEVNTDREKDITRKYNIRGIPAYKIVNGTEKVLHEGVGAKSPEDFLAWLGQNPTPPNNKIPDFTPRDRIDRLTPNDPLDPLTPRDKIDDFLRRE
jgi:thiol:disulfide interchange protein